MLLGERLLKKGLLTEEQLELALREQTSTGALLGNVLHSLGFVSQEAIIETLAQEAGVECIKIKEYDVSDTAIKLVPEAFARKHKIIPLSVDNGTIKVAMANIFDVAVIDELQGLTKYYVGVSAGSHAKSSISGRCGFGPSGDPSEGAIITE